MVPALERAGFWTEMRRSKAKSDGQDGTVSKGEGKFWSRRSERMAIRRGWLCYSVWIGLMEGREEFFR